MKVPSRSDVLLALRTAGYTTDHKVGPLSFANPATASDHDVAESRIATASR
jgi:hypothetical protein